MNVKDLLNNANMDGRCSGIYGIIYLDNYKIYVGSAVSFSRRKTGHLSKLLHKTHENTYLQNIYNKHGLDKFLFIILELCEKEDLLSTEQKWIDIFNSTHVLINVCKVAGSRLGTKASEETRNKLRKSSTGRKLTEEARKKISEFHKGKKKSQAHVEKMRNISKGKKRTKESIKKSSEGHYKKVTMLDLKTSEPLKEFPSILDAHSYLNKKVSSSISRVANGKRNSAYGYKWKFVEE